MEHWGKLMIVFASSMMLGIFFDVTFLDQKFIDLWEYRNQLYPKNRGGSLSAFSTIFNICIYAATLLLFYRKMFYAVYAFGLLLLSLIISSSYFGPSISTNISGALSTLMLYSGAYMSAVLVSKKKEESSLI